MISYSIVPYTRARERMATGDVILWKGGSVISRIIRLWSEYSHASLVLRLKEFKGLKDRRFLLEALASGIELRLLSQRLKGYSGEAWCFPLLDEYAEKRSTIAAWGLNQVGTSYDYGSLFRNILGRVNANARSYFCSEFVFFAFKEAGIVQGDIAPRPEDIAKWKCFKFPIKLKF